MVFESEHIQILTKIWECNEYITIKGINCYGQQFETTGRIATTDDGKIGITAEDGEIFLQFGQSKQAPTRKQTQYFAPFELGNEDGMFSSFCIFEISFNGEVFFENDKKDFILERVQAAQAIRQKALAREGRDVLPDWPVVEALNEMVGKPVVINGSRGVFVGLDGLTYAGTVSSVMRSGPLLGAVPVGRNASVKTESNDGKITTLVEPESRTI